MRRPLPSTTRSFRLLGIFGSFLLIACGGDGGTNPADPSVTLSPPSASLFAGDEVKLIATVSGTSATASYSSTAPGVASVDASGTVRGITPGTTTITASAGGASASAQITVNESSISLQPQDLTVLPGETTQLTATITGGSGHTVLWTSHDDEVATVDDAGLVTAVSPGSSPITASIQGQPGVTASVIVEVPTPAPVVEFASFLDQTGAPLDSDNVAGIFVVNVDIDGYVGTQAAVEIYFDNELFASVPFTIEAPQSAPGPTPPSLTKRETLTDVPLSINTLAIKELPAAGIESILDNAPHVLTGQVNFNGNRTGINIRGFGSGATLTTNNPPVGVVTTNHLGQTILVDGKTFGNGNVDYRIGVTRPGLNDVTRVEVLRGPQGILYGHEATAGVMNFTANRTPLEGYEGAVKINQITAFDAGNNPQAVLIANDYPEFFDNVALGPNLVYVDYAGPTANSNPVSFEDLIIGASTDLQSYMSLKSSFDLGDYTDATGVSSFRWQFSESANNWDTEQNYQIGSELPETNGFSMYATGFARDAFGQGTRTFIENGSGSYRKVAVDLTAPVQMLLPGAFNISDLAAINTHGNWQLQVDSNDPPASGLSWSSGINPTGFDLRMQYKTPNLEEYLYGSADGPERVSFDLRAGWELPWTAAGEYYLDVGSSDKGGNTSELLSLKAVYNPTAPTLTIPLLSGLDAENHFAAGSTMGVQVNAQDVLETNFATAGTYSPTANLYYFSEIHPVATPYDGVFQNNVDLSLDVRGFVPRIEFVEGPLAGTGWHHFSHAGAGVINTSGLTATSLVDILGNLPPAGPTFAESQLVSWFPDLTTTELCLGTGPNCMLRPQTGTASGKGWVPIANGFPSFTEGQLYAMKFGPGGENMFRPVGDPTPVDIVPFGTSGHEVQLNLTFNVLDEGLTEHYDRMFLGLRSTTGDVYGTTTWAVTIKKNF